MPRFRLHLAYDGTDFHGWQRQEPPAGEPFRTVQGVLEEALAVVFGAVVRAQGASRTDAGVHARDQVVAFSVESRIPLERMAAAINARLPEDIRVQSVHRAPEGFDPSIHCVSKGYRYRIRPEAGRRSPVPLFDRRFIFHTVHALDLEAMQRAACAFEGTRDFRAMTSADHGRESTVRTVHCCRVKRLGAYDLAIDVAGPGFLYNMVRIIAGTLMEVGRGRIDPRQVSAILDSLDRSRAGPTLPPHGLTLEWIHLDAEWRREP